MHVSYRVGILTQEPSLLIRVYSQIWFIKFLNVVPKSSCDIITTRCDPELSSQYVKVLSPSLLEPWWRHPFPTLTCRDNYIHGPLISRLGPTWSSYSESASIQFLYMKIRGVYGPDTWRCSPERGYRIRYYGPDTWRSSPERGWCMRIA